MDKKSLKLAKQLKKEIAKEYKILDMRIFGSRARGDFVEESDLDIYLELDKNNSTIRKNIFNIEWKIGFDNDIIIMTLIHSKEEIENGFFKYTPTYKNILKEGIVV